MSAAEFIRQQAGEGAVHCTNGTYSKPADLIVPTMLAGFEFIDKREVTSSDDAFVIAVNSNASMLTQTQKTAAKLEEIKTLLAEVETAIDEKVEDLPDALDKLQDTIRVYMEEGETPREYLARMQEQHAKMVEDFVEVTANMEDEDERAMKVAGPLAEQFPDRKIIVVFYDEETPNALYEDLAATGKADQKDTLHKWGYGASENAPVIEGAECFSETFAFPLPSSTEKITPYSWITTRGTDGQKGKISAVDLRDTEEGLGLINRLNQILFPGKGKNKKYMAPEQPGGPDRKP